MRKKGQSIFLLFIVQRSSFILSDGGPAVTATWSRPAATWGRREQLLDFFPCWGVGRTRRSRRLRRRPFSFLRPIESINLSRKRSAMLALRRRNPSLPAGAVLPAASLSANGFISAHPASIIATRWPPGRPLLVDHAVDVTAMPGAERWDVKTRRPWRGTRGSAAPAYPGRNRTDTMYAESCISTPVYRWSM